VSETLWPGDLLDRDKLATGLGDIVRTHKAGAAISIEGEFGAGKTYFLENLKHCLQTSGHACVYFNAWESDFVQQPLLVLMGDIVRELRILAPEAAQEKLKSAAKELWPLIARVTAKSLLRAGDEELDRLLGPLDEEVNRLFEERSKAQISRHDIQKARAALSELIAVAAEAKPEAFPFVVLVDELDRSHPDSVITFLEAVKHLFGQEKIVFLIANDRRNLEVLVRHRFGACYDVDGYFSKFFNYSVGIQNGAKDDVFLARKLIESGLLADGIFANGGDVFAGIEACTQACLAGLGGSRGNLRRLERCAERINLCARGGGPRAWAYLVGFLVGLYFGDRSLFEKYVRGVRGRDVIDALKSHIPREKSQWVLDWAIASGVPRQEWTERRNVVGAAIGVDRLDSLDAIAYSEIGNRLSGYESAVSWMMGQIGWLLR
jgi:hypothetical protein